MVPLLTVAYPVGYSSCGGPQGFIRLGETFDDKLRFGSHCLDVSIRFPTSVLSSPPQHFSVEASFSIALLFGTLPSNRALEKVRYLLVSTPSCF